MRRLLAPLTRWLDRRIDARTAAAAEAGRSASVDAGISDAATVERRAWDCGYAANHRDAVTRWVV